MLSNFKEFGWVPSLYFIQGLPLTLIAIVSPVLYENYHLSNSKIAFFTSLYALPWLFKPVLSPALETLAEKRNLIVLMQILLAGLVSLLALSVSFQHFFIISGMIFIMVAITSTINDISSDGLYMIGLDTKAQAYFIGIRTLFYQLGRLACQGGLVFAAGYLMHSMAKSDAWKLVLLVLALIIFILALYHRFALPKVESNRQFYGFNITATLRTFRQVFAEFVQLPSYIHIICFILIYNFAESQLIKIVPLFLLDSINHGGLGLTTEWVGILFGSIGIVGMMIGVVLSGFLLTKYSLRQFIIPVTILVGLTNIGYLILSIYIIHQIWIISLVIILAQFGFGISNGAYMMYLLKSFNIGSHPMSLYALGTSLMTFSMTIASAISGYMQNFLGYSGFFSWILIANLLILLFTIYNRKIVLKVEQS